MRLTLIIIGLLATMLISCSSESEQDKQYQDVEGEKVFNPTLLQVNIPENFPELTYDLNSNPPTKEGFALGKKLFYEGKLSSTGIISCGECHRQEFSFTHHKHIVSHGVNGLLGTRNAPPIQNMAFLNEFNWDGAANHLDMQPIIPITSEVEMNETFVNILNKLAADNTYPPLFKAAFENGKIDTANMLKALSQFVVTMISADSKYDKLIRNEGGIAFTAQEKAGQKLFENKCASCHAGTLFTDQSYRNNGLPLDPEYNDVGRKLVTGLAEDTRKFRVPSLRNVALTLPYMHDGRFKTLNDVLDFYSAGVQDSETLDPILKSNNNLGIALSQEEKEQLISFLNTLTDTNFIFDKRFAEF
ncbi:cytochrome-c peroxidase [Aquimarina agarivorans]|uniref:cytochrome-c peroxidase n=1 Tax=Aquimarina agarivorans TaxID=980584 RepID=UPI000248ED5D|nr:cytochrome c peroxidase [Aquimarina agarivorans]